MEKEIYQVLEASGLTEKKHKEIEELELNKLSREEMEERQKELTNRGRNYQISVKYLKYLNLLKYQKIKI